MNAELAARCAARVQEAKERAGLGTPELQSAHHAAVQAHVPRMCRFINRVAEWGHGVGHGPTQVMHWAQTHLHRFAVDVAEDHAVMSAGRHTCTVFVACAARDDVEASLTAAQMASRHGIVVAVRSMP